MRMIRRRVDGTGMRMWGMRDLLWALIVENEKWCSHYHSWVTRSCVPEQLRFEKSAMKRFVLNICHRPPH